jgi:SHS2 domain-containing protein
VTPVNDDFYREFEHTGDLGIEVRAPSRAELFARCALAMSRVMVEPEGVRALERRQIEVQAEDDADLMHDLLAAALNLFMVDGFIWREASAIERDRTIIAVLTGEKFDRSRHQLLTEIKAVTYHRLAIEREGNGWRATIVFDI